MGGHMHMGAGLPNKAPCITPPPPPVHNQALNLIAACTAALNRDAETNGAKPEV